MMASVPLTPVEDRLRLVAAVAALARAIDTGEADPTIEELKTLAQVCDEARLPVEAARIRRWMTR